MATTGFEDRVAAEEFPDWTSNAEELAYLTALSTEYDTIAFEAADRLSEEGRPYHIVRVGHPVAPPADEVGTCVMVIAQQHGDEGAGREAAFQFMRTLASATGTLATYLEGVTWVFIPACNPDRIGITRENANGQDLNRDHISLTQRGTQVIHGAITRYRPEIFLDLHEARNSSEDIEYAHPLHPMTDAGILSLSQDVITSAIQPAAIANGWSYGQYWSNQEENRCTNVTGLRHAVSILLETPRTGTPNEIPREWRVGIHVAMLDAILQWAVDNKSTVSATVSAARAAAITQGAEGIVPFNLRLESINPPPLGYEVTDEQLRNTKTLRELFGISLIRPNIISLAQEAYPLIPFVFDGGAEFDTAQATRLFSGVPTAAEISDLTVIDGVPEVETTESVGEVRFVTVPAGIDLLAEDVAGLAEFGVV